MNTKKLSLILILSGIAATILSVIWFFAAFAETMDTISTYGGSDMAGKMMSCLYSSPPMCEGASYLSDGPSYSPIIFWIGVLALLSGVVMRMTLNRSSAAGAAPLVEGSAPPSAATDGKLLGFLPPEKFTRTAYILVLSGAVCVLLVPPLVIIGIAGFVLAILGLLTFRARLTPLDSNHLTAIAVVFVASCILLFMTAGNFLFLLFGLIQLLLYYIGFNSFRHTRMISVGNFKEEAQLALKPLNRPPSKPDGV